MSKHEIYPLLCEVKLVSHKNFAHIRLSVHLNLLHPRSDALECGLVRDIIDQYNSLYFSVIGIGNGSKSLLAGSIPLSKRGN